jgi:predicted amidohydrolase
VQSLHFDVLDRARAIENQVVWVSANLTGRRGGRVDLAEVARARAMFSHLDDRWPAAYPPAVLPTGEAPLAVAG